MRQHLEALLVLAPFVVLLVLGTPILDFQDWRDFDEPEELDALARDYGRWAARIAGATARVNRSLRHPVYELLAPLQRPVRARQSWHLYRDGPTRVLRLEVYVDGQLVHRSADDAHAWRSAQLRNRKIRPVVENLARKKSGPNWRGMVRWIVAEARADWPEAREVRLVATKARFPGIEAEPQHAYVATAPGWEPRQAVAP